MRLIEDKVCVSMENDMENNVPFLTRFFRARAEDVEVPDIDLPVPTKE
jgi:hypothetical protein